MLKIFIIILSVLGILVVAALLLPFSLFQNLLVKEINKVKDLNVEIHGKINYRLIRPDLLEIDQVRIDYRNVSVDLSELKIDLALAPLWDQKVVIENLFIDAKKLVISEKASERSPSNAQITGAFFYVRDFLVMKAQVKLAYLRTEDFEFSQLSLSGPNTFYSIKTKKLDSRLTLKVGDDIFAVTGPITGEIGNSLKFDLKTERADIARTLAYFNIEGLDVIGQANLSSAGEFSFSNPLETLKGELILDAQDLRWKGRDIDAILSSYIDSQRLGLIDAAGFLSLGPIGLLVAKGLSLSEAGLQGIISGESFIGRLYAKTSIDEGLLRLEDVAMRTKRYRVAAKGGIRLGADYQFKDLKISPVDERGCSLFVQELQGTLQKPRIGVLTSAAGDVLSTVGDIFKRAQRLIGSCEPFYQGVVEPPVN